MGLIDNAVNKMVQAVAEEEVKTKVKDAVDSKVDELVTNQINKVLENGIARTIETVLIKKLEPVIKEIEKIDVSSVVDKVKTITIGDDVDSMVDEFTNTIKEKIKSGIEQANLINVDISTTNERANEIIAEHVEDILEDDCEVETIIIDGVRGIVKKKFQE